MGLNFQGRHCLKTKSGNPTKRTVGVLKFKSNKNVESLELFSLYPGVTFGSVILFRNHVSTVTVASIFANYKKFHFLNYVTNSLRIIPRMAIKMVELY